MEGALNWLACDHFGRGGEKIPEIVHLRSFRVQLHETLGPSTPALDR